MQIHLVDGTYELFRYFYSPATPNPAVPENRRAVHGVLNSILGLIEGGATHVGVATDHVIESFRNDLWPGYKTGAGMDPLLLEQFEPLEVALRSMGVVVWAMVEFEADDALAAAAALADRDPRVEQVIICTPDKDLSQCVRDDRVVQLDRRQGETRNVEGVRAKFGVPPASIPDWLALVGDSADGFPGLPGWGAKSSATVLARYGRLEDIPPGVLDWDITVRGAMKLAATLAEGMNQALLFRTLATLRTDIALFDDIHQLQWNGPTPAFPALGARFDAAVTETRRPSGRRSSKRPDP